MIMSDGCLSWQVAQMRKLRHEDGSVWTVNTLAKLFEVNKAVVRCVG